MGRLASRIYGEGFIEGKGHMARTQRDERRSGDVTTQRIALLILSEGDKGLLIEIAILLAFDGVLVT